MSDDILKRVGDIVIDTLDLDNVEIQRATTAEEIEEWDSLSHIRLVVAIEREFGIKFSNTEIESLSSVGDLVDMIATKI